MPELSGLVQTFNEQTKERNEIGRIALWSNTSENPRAPKYVGEIQAKEGGSKFRVSIWENENKQKKEGGGKPFLPSYNCWACGKRISEKELILNYCNNCATYVHSK